MTVPRSGTPVVGPPSAPGAEPAAEGGTAPVRRRHPPAQRRAQLVAAARTVIAQRGLHATTLRDVAAAGGVSLGTVTYHFDGIAEVLAGVLDAEMSTYSAPVWARAAAGDTGRAGLTELVDSLLASDPRTGEHWRLWLDFWAMAAHRERYAEWQAEVYRDLHQLVEGILRRGQDDGSLRVAAPAAAAVCLVALLDGLVVQAYLPQPRISAAAARALLHDYVARTFTAD